MHRTATLDLMVVLSGRVLLGLDDGEQEVGPGDAVVQRGTRHRWRVIGEQPCTFLSVLLSPVSAARPAEIMSAHPVDAAQPSVTGRFVTDTVNDRSTLLRTGAPTTLDTSAVVIRDWWQTGGAVHTVDQGGDAAAWSLEPVGAGVSLRTVEFAAGHDPGEAGWHRTGTIDVDLVLSGSLELALPGADEHAPGSRAVLEPGDVVVMRGVTHRWRPLGDRPAAMASVMFGLQQAP